MDNMDKAVLSKILAESAIINDLIRGYECDSFLTDERTKRAVSMTLINIGELVKLLSDEFRQSNTSIPWRKIAGLRDVTAHGYQTLRMEDIWNTVIVDIPVLQKEINKIVNSF